MRSIHLRRLALGAAIVAASARGALAQPAAAPPSPPSPQSAAQPALPSVVLPPELDRVLRDYERAWGAHDADALAALFTEDGFVLQMGRPPARGRAAIREAYRSSGGPLRLRALAFAHSGDTGYIIGGFGQPGDAPDVGKFVLTLRRDRSGRWLIVSDMDNPNARPMARPSPGPAAPPA